MNDVEEKSTVKIEALCRRCVTLFSQYTEASGNSPAESLISVAASDDAAYIADFVAQNVYLKPEEAAASWKSCAPTRRLARLCSLVSRELTLLGIERDISESTQEQMNRNQREYYLREQLESDTVRARRRRHAAGTGRLPPPHKGSCILTKTLRRSCSRRFLSSHASPLARPRPA